MTVHVYKTVESDVPLLYHIGLLSPNGKRQHPIKYDRYYKQETIFRLANDSHLFPFDGFYYEYVTSKELTNYRNLYGEIKPDIDIAIQTHDIKPITEDEKRILSDLGDLTTEKTLEELDKELTRENNRSFRSQRRSKLGETSLNALGIVTDPIEKGAQLVQTTITDTQEILDSLLLPVAVIGGVVLIALVLK